MNSSTCDFGNFSCNSSTNLATGSIRQLVETVAYAGLTTLVCVVGIPTNIFNSLVFWRQGLRDRMNICLFSLAIVYSFFYTLQLAVRPVASFIQFYDISLHEEYFYKANIAVSSLMYGLLLTSSCINMAIAVDTCVSVVFPHRAASLMGTTTMASLIVLCFLLIQVCYVVIPLSYRVVQQEIDGKVRWAAAPSNFFNENEVFIFVFEKITLDTVLPLVSLSVILVTSTITVRKLKFAITWRKNIIQVTDSLQNRQVALTKMLTIVAFVFVFVRMPDVCLAFTWGLLLRHFYEPEVLDKFMTAMAVIYVLGNADGCLNFFIYYRRSSRFRRELCNMFSCIAFTNNATSATNTHEKTDTHTDRIK